MYIYSRDKYNSFVFIIGIPCTGKAVSQSVPRDSSFPIYASRQAFGQSQRKLHVTLTLYGWHATLFSYGIQLVISCTGLLVATMFRSARPSHWLDLRKIHRKLIQISANVCHIIYNTGTNKSTSPSVPYALEAHGYMHHNPNIRSTWLLQITRDQFY